MSVARSTEGTVKTQLIAHDKEVFDIAFTRMASGREIFATVGAFFFSLLCKDYLFIPGAFVVKNQEN